MRITLLICLLAGVSWLKPIISNLLRVLYQLQTRCLVLSCLRIPSARFHASHWQYFWLFKHHRCKQLQPGTLLAWCCLRQNITKCSLILKINNVLPKPMSEETQACLYLSAQPYFQAKLRAHVHFCVGLNKTFLYCCSIVYL